MRLTPWATLVVACSSAFVATALAEEPARSFDPSGAITHRDVLSAALAGSPELGAFSAELRAREALTLQAARHPNPTLRGDLENVGGSGTRQGVEDTEATLLLSQLVELGGKRTKRIQTSVDAG